MSGHFEDLQKRFQSIIAVIDEAESKVHEGMIVDLSGLDKDAAGLCAAIEDASPSDAKALQPYIAEMITKLEGLEKTLNAFRDQHKKEDR